MYEEAPGNYVAAVSEQGRMLLFQIAEMKQMAKGRGVIIMGLEKGEKLVAVRRVGSAQPDRVGHRAAAQGRTATIRRKDMRHYAGHRARMGRVLPDKLKPQTLKVLAEAGNTGGVGNAERPYPCPFPYPFPA